MLNFFLPIAICLFLCVVLLQKNRKKRRKISQTPSLNSSGCGVASRLLCLFSMSVGDRVKWLFTLLSNEKLAEGLTVKTGDKLNTINVSAVQQQ